MVFFLKKLFYLLITLFLVITLTFFLMQSVPGDPFTDEKALPKETLDALYQHYGLNDPWHKQYLNYLQAIVKWDLGPSFKYANRSVNEIISEGFSVSVILGLEAFFLALTGGVILGTVAAVKQHRLADFGAMFFATMGVSIPSFIVATLLQYFFALKLGVFPIARWGTFLHTILPVLALSASPIAFIARLTRSNMIELLQQDYIKTAKAKGLSFFTIIIRHALRNALCPLLPYFGQLAANILVGSFIIEKIFAIPGLGQWFVMSISNRDYPVIMGTTVFYSCILLTLLFISDIIYNYLDPRINLKHV